MLKKIPQVDKVLKWPAVKELLRDYPRPVLLGAVRAVLAQVRAEMTAGGADSGAVVEEEVVPRIKKKLTLSDAFSLKRVVNGTGVVIHTNLGRAPLPESVRHGLTEIACGYSNLEFDLEQGVRGSRYSHVEQLLCGLTGAEAALVVNNNAAAVFLALSSLAAGREVVVSRGELVEIGGSFRIPEIMRQSNAHLREVGTTNRTHPSDYRDAITPQTALLLKVHTSNYAVVGFTAEVSAEGLAAIGKEVSLPVMADIGSGNLIDLARFLGKSDPTVQEFLRAGIDVVTFSGDKLLGGPQAGIIVGKKSLLDPMKKHPLLRALRMDKLTLAALEGTLRLYRDERQALAAIPVLRMLAATAPELAARGKALVRRLRRILPQEIKLSLVSGSSQVGGGALPLLELPTSLIAVELPGVSARLLESRMRNCIVPVIGRISRERFLLDLRTIMEEDVPLLISSLGSL